MFLSELASFTSFPVPGSLVRALRWAFPAGGGFDDSATRKDDPYKVHAHQDADLPPVAKTRSFVPHVNPSLEIRPLV